MWFVSGYVLFMSFAPVLLISRGMSVAQAGFLVSMSAIVALGSVPLGGYLTDRTRKPNVFITLGALGAAFACFMLPQGGHALFWILLFGLLRGACTGGIMALPSEVLRPGSRNAGFGLSSTVYFLGLSAIPPLAGWILDATHNHDAPLWFATGLWMMIPLTLLTFRVLQRRWVSHRP
jgi:MFS family permease